jgi:putative membrane protein
MLAVVVIAAFVVGGITQLFRTPGDFIAVGFGAIRGLLLILPAAGLSAVSLSLGTRAKGILRVHRLVGIITVTTILLLALWLLSTFIGWIIDFIYVFLGIPITGVTALFFLRGFILGAAFSLSITYLVVLITTTVGSVKGALLSIIFPATSFVSFILTEPLLTSPLLFQIVAIYLLLSLIYLICVQLLLYAVGRKFKKALNVDGIKLFRGFLMVWMEGHADQIEACFKQLGKRVKLPLAVLRFTTGKQKPQLVFVIAGVHPGPFRDTGSSTLPSAIAKWGRETLGVVACAPHGTATHALNLVARDEISLLLADVQETYNQIEEVDSVSQFARASSGTIQAGCQLFGDTALIVISRSPEEMDDISLPVGRRVQEAVEKLVKHCIVVDTHNCIGELRESIFEESGLVQEMVDAAVKATKKALKRKRGDAGLGTATKQMQEYGPAVGMGPEGITASVIDVGGQRMAYVIIDGNNMAVGLREKLLKTLVPDVVDAAEILTTDTHQVAAISTKGEGYSPIGLDIPQEAIIKAVKEVTREAASKIEPTHVAVKVGETQPLHVMGEGTVETITNLIPVSARTARRVGIASFGAAFFISLLLLTLV